MKVNLKKLSLSWTTWAIVALLSGSPRAGAQTGTNAPAAPLAAQVTGKVLITAQHYAASANGATTANLLLGYYRLAADGSATRFHYLFLPADNSSAILTTNLRTPMTPKGNGTPGKFRIPAHARQVDSAASTWNATAVAIELRNGDGTNETWRLENPDHLLFLLQLVTHSSSTIGANTYGVAMLADDITRLEFWSTVRRKESEIVATDKRLREAALALGFNTFPPP